MFTNPELLNSSKKFNKIQQYIINDSKSPEVILDKSIF